MLSLEQLWYLNYPKKVDRVRVLNALITLAYAFFGTALVSKLSIETGISATGAGNFCGTTFFQISFFPDLVQVNFSPAATDLAPAFLQKSPVFTAAFAVVGIIKLNGKTKERVRTVGRVFFEKFTRRLYLKGNVVIEVRAKILQN